MIPLPELTPFPGNARRGDPVKIAESITANGQYRALVVRAHGDSLTVLAGNHTLKGLEILDSPAARCEVIDCDDETARRINLVDNKASDDGTYDEEALAALLGALDTVVGTGYSDEEVDSIVARYEPEEEASYVAPQVHYNDTDEEREARIKSHGGPDSRTMESRGIRDVILAMPSAEADELGRMIMKLRETWGALSQGEVLLRAARVAVRALDSNPEGTDLYAVLAEQPYSEDEPDAA